MCTLRHGRHVGCTFEKSFLVYNSNFIQRGENFFVWKLPGEWLHTTYSIQILTIGDFNSFGFFWDTLYKDTTRLWFFFVFSSWIINELGMEIRQSA